VYQSSRLKNNIYLLMILFFILNGSTYAKTIIGWTEIVQIDGSNLSLEAKIDTGADITSIHSEILAQYNFNDEKWIKFQIDNGKDGKIVFEKKLLRFAKIKRKQEGILKRPVVLMSICMGSVVRDIEVNLSNRSNFEYPMLIGKNMLRKKFLVDVALKNTIVPNCNWP